MLTTFTLTCVAPHGHLRHGRGGRRAGDHGWLLVLRQRRPHLSPRTCLRASALVPCRSGYEDDMLIVVLQGSCAVFIMVLVATGYSETAFLETTGDDEQGVPLSREK